MNNLLQEHICPYCQTPMELGSILGDRYKLKWLPKGKKLFLGIWAKGALILGKRGFNRPKLEGWHCSKCKLIITKY